MYKKVYVEITNVCNMNCSFCHGHRRTPRQMSEEEFSVVLEKLQGKTNFIYYHLMGEPLTHPLLPRFLEMAKESGYKSIITTNGTLLKKRESEILSESVHKINISIHSFENEDREAHIEYIKGLADFSKKAASNGTIIVFRLWNKGLDDGKNQLAIEALKESVSPDWTENSRGFKLQDKIYLEFGDRFEWPDLSAEIKGDKFFCYGLKDQFGILSNGTVVPCCLDSDGIIDLGNIFEEDIDSILSSKRAADMVNGFRCGKATEELCQKCGYAQKFV
ncbi:MAG: radical SAM protein [Clostridia bacterium]|nr:radical SAM protein [Clostridia bacterium]